MKLKEILVGLEGLKVRGNLDVEIDHLDKDSRNIKENGLFIAIKGFDTDGHEYIETAINQGATAIMVQEGVNVQLLKKIPEEITIIVVKDTRYALAICSCNFYQNPSRKFKLIGITGTKGKTTTSFMTKAILEKTGKKVGLIGTIATYIGNKKLEDSDRTTPESNKLQAIFAKMAQEGCDAVVMEVSSQSLKLNRVAGCDFDIGVFTNFSEDHISPKEHPDMEDYFNSKVQLFKMCKKAFINADDFNTAKLPKLVPQCEITTYGIDNFCNVLAKDITITNSYVDFKVKIATKNERIKTCIPGRFSVYNSLAAICVGERLGANAEQIKEALEEVRVPGRSELINNKKDLTIMVDYAHSPESLENILNAVKSYTKGRVISLFGCGGDRDSGKRPIMGEISGRIADFTIITSDNPRTEDPKKIVEQIEEGIKKTKGKYTVIVDRVEAIKEAIKMADKKDIIVLAGKGHEPYQEINGIKYPFDERIIVNSIINTKQ
ncbi:MAG: UDP-N-acetylmuramoyl-L-alanyl-D-glutamate--2,6-diaminopimelate ligase [Clostridiaceae bacterium]|nr:UDP-N-acetylmuramoyl-L-alanyl-D-glutamate--2,6-diaminopimelate ligase [Clostridiaceae bacterium]